MKRIWFGYMPAVRIARDLRGCALNYAEQGCRTRQQNSHSIAALDDAERAYAAHPWAGWAVCVHEVAEGRTGSVARCNLVDDGAARAQEIPVWVPDVACCRTLSGVTHPVPI